MSRAGPPLPVEPDLPPLSILVDYDGTISLLDVGDTLLARFADPPEVARLDADYEAGLIGSRALMRWDMDVLPPDADLLREAAASIPLDAGFRAFVELARSHGVVVEVVSDGLGFPVTDGLAHLRLGDVPVATNENRLAGGGSGMAFPYGHPHCFVCGTCKRARVLAHQASGRAVVFIGDGVSDRYAAFHSDLVFAKDQLAELCRRQGWAYRPWTDFTGLTEWLAAALAESDASAGPGQPAPGDLPMRSSRLDGWRAAHPSAARADLDAGGSGFVCGPEVWGPDRSTPLPTGAPPDPSRGRG